MAELRDYYLTVTYPDGSVSGPTRLLGVHTEKQAKTKLRQFEKSYPDCEIEVS